MIDFIRKRVLQLGKRHVRGFMGIAIIASCIAHDVCERTTKMRPSKSRMQPVEASMREAMIAARGNARVRIGHHDAEPSNLKIFKVLPKCGSKPLIFSICGGNMPMKMMKTIIIAHDNNIMHDAMQDRSM